MSLRSLFITIATMVLLGLGGIIAIQGKILGDTRDQLDDARRELVTVKRTVVELERDAERTAARETARRTAREAIVSGPATDDGEISPLLLQGLRGADLIGGHE